MYFGAGIPKLNHAIKSIRTAWEGTQDGWRDQVHTDFEEQHVEPFVAQATTTLRAMEQLADTFARIYRECSDSE